VEAVEYFLLRFQLLLLLSLLPLSHSWDFLLPAPDKVGRFRVRFRFQLILLKRFRFLRFLSNGMLTAQHKTENLICRKSVKFTA